MSANCPTCGRALASERGMRSTTHWSTTNDCRTWSVPTARPGSAARKSGDTAPNRAGPNQYRSRERRTRTTGGERKRPTVRSAERGWSTTLPRNLACTVPRASKGKTGDIDRTSAGRTTHAGGAARRNSRVSCATNRSSGTRATLRVRSPSAVTSVERRGSPKRSPVAVTRTGGAEGINRTVRGGTRCANERSNATTGRACSVEPVSVSSAETPTSTMSFQYDRSSNRPC